MMSGPDMSTVYLNTLYGNRTNKKGKELDKDAFLLLLLTELKNQNPLEPLDNKDLIAQLSQLTSLEQITNMTKSVTDFINANVNFMKAQAASMIGKNVVVRANDLTLQDGKASPIFFNLQEPSRIIVKIVDSSGKEVFYKDLGTLSAGLQYFTWDGKSTEGIALPDGKYYYSVLKVNPDGTVEDIGGLEQGKVEAVQFDSGQIYLLINGKRYPITSIVEIS